MRRPWLRTPLGALATLAALAASASAEAAPHAVASERLGQPDPDDHRRRRGRRRRHGEYIDRYGLVRTIGDAYGLPYVAAQSASLAAGARPCCWRWV
jgi:hypothetical protein